MPRTAILFTFKQNICLFTKFCNTIEKILCFNVEYERSLLNKVLAGVTNGNFSRSIGFWFK